jgi:hypothetical protein
MFIMSQRPNFSQLWEQALSTANFHKNERLKSVLLNFSNKKELICRKFGIIGNQDVIRLENNLAKNAKNNSRI